MDNDGVVSIDFKPNIRIIMKRHFVYSVLSRALMAIAVILASFLASCTRTPAKRLLYASFDHDNHVIDSSPDITLPEGDPVGDRIEYAPEGRLKVKGSAAGGKELELTPIGEITHGSYLEFRGIETVLKGVYHYSWDGILENPRGGSGDDLFAIVDFGASGTKGAGASFGRIQVYGNGKVTFTDDYSRAEQELGFLDLSSRHFVSMTVNTRRRFYDLVITDGKATYRRGSIPFLHLDTEHLNQPVVPTVSYNARGRVLGEGEKDPKYRLDNVYVGQHLPEMRDITFQPGQIGVLCPFVTNMPEGSGRDFEGGPHINSKVRLEVRDRRRVVAIVYFKASRGHASVEQTWEKEIYQAPEHEEIVRIITPAHSEVNFTGNGAGAEFGICGDGSPVEINLEALQNPVRSISIIGDTGYDDISNDENCACDTKINFIKFHPVSLRVLSD